MNIRIGDYGIRADGLNFTLYRVAVVTGENARGKKPKAESIGQERERHIGYYARLDHALSGWLKQEISDDQINTIKGLLFRLSEVERKFEEFKILISKFKESSSGHDDPQ